MAYWIEARAENAPHQSFSGGAAPLVPGMGGKISKKVSDLPAEPKDRSDVIDRRRVDTLVSSFTGRVTSKLGAALSTQTPLSYLKSFCSSLPRLDAHDHIVTVTGDVGLFLEKDVLQKTVRILESLLLVFFARKSLKDIWFTKAEIGIWEECAAKSLAVLIYYRHLRADLEQSFVKYHNDKLLSIRNRSGIVQKNPLFSLNLYYGAMKKYLGRRMAHRDLSFFVSLQKGSKQAWYSLGDESLAGALKEHAKANSDDQDEVSLELSFAIQKVLYEVVEFYHDDGTPQPFTKFTPNQRATFEAGRKAFGQLGTFGFFKYKYEKTYLVPEEPMMQWTSLVNQFEEWKQDVLTTAVYRSFGMEVTGCFSSARLSSLGPEFQDGQVASGVLPEVPSALFRDEIVPLLSSRVVAIPEPSKFRILAIGNSCFNVALQPIQGMTLNWWKKSGWSTMRTEDLKGRVERLWKPYPELGLLSIDYKSSTDLMKKSTVLETYHLLEQMARINGRHDVAAGVLVTLQSLRAGTIRYPSGEYDPELLKKQKNDPRMKVAKNHQEREAIRRDLEIPKYYLGAHIDSCPMGGLPSFFALCVVNEALFFQTVAEIQKELAPLRPRDPLPWKVVPVVGRPALSGWTVKKYRRLMKHILRTNIVNGDDALVVCDEYFREKWSRNAIAAGLHPSPGKNYHCTDFAMINSQYYEIVGDRVIRRPYLNQAILREVIPSAELGRVGSQILSGLPWFSCCVPALMLRTLIDPDLEPETFSEQAQENRLNWYLPLLLGGLGIERKFAPKDSKVTRDQRRLAAYLLLNPEYRVVETLKYDPDLRLGRSLQDMMIKDRLDEARSYLRKLKGIFKQVRRPKLIMRPENWGIGPLPDPALEDVTDISDPLQSLENEIAMSLVHVKDIMKRIPGWVAKREFRKYGLTAISLDKLDYYGDHPKLFSYRGLELPHVEPKYPIIVEEGEMKGSEDPTSHPWNGFLSVPNVPRTKQDIRRSFPSPQKAIEALLRPGETSEDYEWL
jgi:hypothetical protein